MRVWSVFLSLSFAACVGSQEGVTEPPASTGGGKNLGGSGGADNVGGSGGVGVVLSPSGHGGSESPNGDGGGNGALACPAEPSATLYLSPDDSGSMASPVWARELLRKGVLPEAARIRPWEFLNYYHFDLPEPPAGDRVELHAELVELEPSARWELLIAVRARSMPRPQVGMTFVVDTSASMAGPGMARARRAVTTLVESLQAGDVISVVKWSSDAVPLVDGVTVQAGKQGELAAQIASELAPFGGSDLTGGLQAGYALAKKNFVAGGHNRVVLLSDGGASPSSYDLEEITKELGQADESAIFLTGVGVGPAEGYDDKLMNAVTDAARGSYAYVDEPERAPLILGDRFDELMFVAEEAITVRLDLPGYMVLEGTSAEGVDVDPNKIRDQHIAPGDAVVLHQYLSLMSSCDPSVVSSPAYPQALSVSVSSGKGAQMTSLDALSVGLPGEAKASGLVLKARAIHALSTALQQGDLLALQEAHAGLALALAGLPSDLELDDLVGTLDLFFSLSQQ